MFRIIVLLCLLVASTALHAGENEARVAFDQATEAFANEDYKNASTLFRKAYKLKPFWKLQYNIGHCEAAAKRHGLALEAFEAYLSEGGDEISEIRVKEIEEELDRLKRKVGFLDITAPEGANVFVGDIDRGISPFPGPMAISSGTIHTLRIELNGEMLMSRPIKVSGGQTVSLVANKAEVKPSEHKKSVASDETAETEVPINPGVEDESRDLVETTTPGAGLKKAGIALIIVGGATIVTGAIIGGIALGESNSLNDDCIDGCPEEFYNDNDKMHSKAVVSTILYPVGGALAAAGLIMAIVGKKKGAKETVFKPVVGRKFAGILLKGRF